MKGPLAVFVLLFCVSEAGVQGERPRLNQVEPPPRHATSLFNELKDLKNLVTDLQLEVAELRRQNAGILPSCFKNPSKH